MACVPLLWRTVAARSGRAVLSCQELPMASRIASKRRYKKAGKYAEAQTVNRMTAVSMTPTNYDRIVNAASVRIVDGGLFVQGVTLDELAELLTIAGRSLGTVRGDASINPQWLEARAGRWMVNERCVRVGPPPRSHTD